jgi:arsenite transporter
MSAPSIEAPTAAAGMSVFERYLTVWVALCIVVGITLGQLFPHRCRRSAGWSSRRSICRSACSSG